MTEPTAASVPARAALAGNPSDGYGGAVDVKTIMAELADLARSAAQAIESRDVHQLKEAMGQTFALRCEVMDVISGRTRDWRRRLLDAFQELKFCVLKFFVVKFTALVHALNLFGHRHQFGS